MPPFYTSRHRTLRIRPLGLVRVFCLVTSICQSTPTPSRSLSRGFERDTKLSKGRGLGCTAGKATCERKKGWRERKRELASGILWLLHQPYMSARLLERKEPPPPPPASHAKNPLFQSRNRSRPCRLLLQRPPRCPLLQESGLTVLAHWLIA